MQSHVLPGSSVVGVDGVRARSARSDLGGPPGASRRNLTDLGVQRPLTEGLVEECPTGPKPPADLVVIGRERANATIAVFPEAITASSPETSVQHEERNAS